MVCTREKAARDCIAPPLPTYLKSTVREGEQGSGRGREGGRRRRRRRTGIKFLRGEKGEKEESVVRLRWGQLLSLLYPKGRKNEVRSDYLAKGEEE